MAGEVFYFELDGEVFVRASEFVPAAIVKSGPSARLVDYANIWKPRDWGTNRFWMGMADIMVMYYHQKGLNAFKYRIDNHVITLPKTLKDEVRDHLDAPLPEGVPPLIVPPFTPSDENLDDLPPQGDETYRFRKERVNQGVFRDEILNAYGNRCCITGIDIKELLVASHIKPWKDSDPNEKTDPRNGLCLNALHDRAFDRGLIAIADDFTVMVSNKLASYKNKENEAMHKMLLDYDGKKIKLPANRSKPLIELLMWHRKNVYKA